jgi:hypothetical protein
MIPYVFAPFIPLETRRIIAYTVMVGDQYEVYSVSNGIHGASLPFILTRDKSRNYDIILDTPPLGAGMIPLNHM